MLNKKVILLLPILLLLQACNNPSEEYLKKEQLKKEFKAKSDNSCPLAYLDSNKDILVANIYFKNFSSKTNTEDNKVIKNVATMHSKCPQNILLVGHASSKEGSKDIIMALNLSLERVKTVKSLLEKNKVFDSYINIMFCGVSNNKVDEKVSPNNYLYNQRVDIVFLTTELEKHEFDCISTHSLE